MSLESNVKRGLAMFKEHSKSGDGVWAYKVCKLSQEITEDVLECCPPAEYVENDILQAFFKNIPRLIREIKNRGQGGDFTTYLEGFALNIENRISKLRAYVTSYDALPSYASNTKP